MKEQLDPLKVLVDGSDFDKTLILDNFYQNIDVQSSSSADLAKLLDDTIRGTENLYIIRCAFTVLCDLTSLSLINNEYVALFYLKDFLASSDETLTLIALKYLPYFPSVYGKEQNKIEALSDSDNGDIASQAFFCMGLSTLISPSVSRTSEEVVLNFSKAKQHFIAARQSVGNREDASFFIYLIDYLNGVFLLDKKKWRSAFSQIEVNLKIRSLYQIDSGELEFEFLIFKLIQLLKGSLDLVAESEEWLEFYAPLKNLSEAYFQVQILQRLSGPHSESMQLFYQSSVRLLEEKIYKISLLSSRYRLQKMHDTTEEDSLQKFLAYMLPLFPIENQLAENNHELLALLSSKMEANSALEIYAEVKGKGDPAMSALEHLLKKEELGRFAIRTGSIHGQVVFQSLAQQIDHYLPDYPKEKKRIFFKILEEVIRYTRATLVGYDKKKFAFLYNRATQKNNPQYLGDSAREEDLQDSMLNFSSIQKYLMDWIMRNLSLWMAVG